MGAGGPRPSGRGLLEVTDDVRAAAAQLVERSTSSQGLPAVVEDGSAIGKIAALIRREAPALDAKPRRQGEVDCAKADG